MALTTALGIVEDMDCEFYEAEEIHIDADTFDTRLGTIEQMEATKMGAAESVRRVDPSVPVMKSVTLSHVKEIYELLQSPKSREACIDLRFAYVEEMVGKMPSYKAVLKFQDQKSGQVIQEIETPSFHPSKRHAKEEAARLGLDFANSVASGKYLSMPENATGENNQGAVDSNWISQLAEMCQKRGVLPEYIFYEPSTHSANMFSCEVKLASKILHSSGGGWIFGSTRAMFLRKKTAKAFAAKEAVLWLNSQSSFSDEGQGRKESDSIIFVPASERTAGSKVNYICPKLGLLSPEHEFNSHPDTGCLNASVLIRRFAGGKTVKIGPIINLRGKKYAKESLAEATLLFLTKEAHKQGFQIVHEELEHSMDLL